jgi:hypothetical protein
MGVVKNLDNTSVGSCVSENCSEIVYRFLLGRSRLLIAATIVTNGTDYSVRFFCKNIIGNARLRGHFLSYRPIEESVFGWISC